MTVEHDHYSGIEYFVPSFELEITRGNIPGASHEHKFGLNLTVGATFETVWTMSTVYAYLTAETTLNISSGDVDDTAAGAGAQQIKIEGLDGNHNPISEHVEMNGQTAVATAKKYLRVHRMMVTRGASNQGIVYAGVGGPASGVPTTTYGAIAAGYGQTLQALYTIPGGHTGYLYQVEVSSGVVKDVIARLLVRPLDGVFQTKDVLNLIQDASISNWRFPLEIPEKSDIELQANAAGAGGSVEGSFTILILEDS